MEVVAAYMVGASYGGLTNSYMTDAERAAVDPDSREAYNRMMGSKIQIIGWNFYAAILWGLKFCVTTFYSRLTFVIRPRELHCKPLLGFGWRELTSCLELGWTA